MKTLNHYCIELTQGETDIDNENREYFRFSARVEPVIMQDLLQDHYNNYRRLNTKSITKFLKTVGVKIQEIYPMTDIILDLEEEELGTCVECDKLFIHDTDLELCGKCMDLFDTYKLWNDHDADKINALDFNGSAKIREKYRIKIKKHCYEHCPHCDRDVRLKNIFKVQTCPKCKKKIKPCNICNMNEVNCKKCKLKIGGKRK